MRLYLLTFLALFGMSAATTDNWKALPYDQSAYNYPDDKSKEAWPRLARNFGGYSYPDADWVVNMATAHLDVLEKTVKAGTSFTGRSGETAQYAARLQDIWRLLLRGDYTKAKKQGPALGVDGQVPAMFVQVLYVMFLTLDQAEKQRLLEEVIDYIEQTGPLVKADIAAQFSSVYIKAHLAEELSVPVVPKRGYTSETPKELGALLARRSNQLFALVLYDDYEAGMVRKTGKLVGKTTYGVSVDRMEQYSVRSFRQTNDLPVDHYKYTNVLTHVYGDDEQGKAITQLKQAATIGLTNAMETLEVAHTKRFLAGFKQNIAQR